MAIVPYNFIQLTSSFSLQKLQQLTKPQTPRVEGGTSLSYQGTTDETTVAAIFQVQAFLQNQVEVVMYALQI